MSTKRTDLGDQVLIETVASWHGGPKKASGGVLVPASDKQAIRAEIVRQAVLLRQRKGVQTPLSEPVV